MKPLINLFVVYPSIPLLFVASISMGLRWALIPGDRRRSEWMLVISSLGISLASFSAWVVESLIQLRRMKCDEFIYRIDSVFGQPSFFLGKIVFSSQALIELVSVSYGLLSAMMVLTIGVYLWYRTDEETVTVALSFLLNLFLAIPVYLLCPVGGPAFAFSGFPFAAPAFTIPHMIAIAVPPNGVPSVHTSSALLVLWFLRKWRWGTIVGSIFLALTIFSALASGQHYLFDLFCAVPYAAFVIWVSQRLILLAGRMRGPPLLAEQ
jgi:PAP2 superfamily protein